MRELVKGNIIIYILFITFLMITISLISVKISDINRKRKELFYNLSNIIRCDHRKNRDGAIVRYKGNTYYVNVNKKYFKLIHNN